MYGWGMTLNVLSNKCIRKVFADEGPDQYALASKRFLDLLDSSKWICEVCMCAESLNPEG